MPTRTLLPATIAALLCISLPAGGQDHAPDGASKTGTVAPTSVRVSFEEWTVPTPRSFPHDPLAAADGTIWYAGQMASTLGRLDPKTGAFKEYRTKTPDSGPHGLAADKDGNIWFAASFQGYIGKLDPKTGTITECWREQSNRRGLLRLTRSLWAFGEPQKSIRLIAICFSLQILIAGGADGYNDSNGSAMSLNKKRPLAALYFANRIIQRDFPLRAYVAPNVGDPFMGAHSFSSVNALYLHGVRHPNLLTGACYQDCHAFVRYAIALSKDGSLRCPARLRRAKRRRRRTAPGITGQSVRTYAAMRNRFMFPHAAIHHSRRSRQALFSSMN